MAFLLFPYRRKIIARARPLFAFCWVFIVLTESLLLCRQGACDRIILKDGTVEESLKVWESEDYVHFILKGTQDVEIRYAKEIVERVEGFDQAAVHGGPPARQHADGVSDAVGIAPPGVDAQQPVTAATIRNWEEHAVKANEIARESRGISFYDPRRPMRYWATSDSKHHDLQAALLSISKIYGQSVQWVTAHMGEQNDLGVIHFNLLKQAGREQPGSVDQSHAVSLKFLDDGSAEKKSKEPADKAHDLPMGSVSSVAPSPDPVERRVQFYDPRRPEKYWSGQMTRHHTLKEAIEALARQYGVSLEWIEDHMGETNELSVIHRNIRRSLERP